MQSSPGTPLRKVRKTPYARECLMDYRSTHGGGRLGPVLPSVKAGYCVGCQEPTEALRGHCGRAAPGRCEGCYAGSSPGQGMKSVACGRLFGPKCADPEVSQAAVRASDSE